MAIQAFSICDFIDNFRSYYGAEPIVFVGNQENCQNIYNNVDTMTAIFNSLPPTNEAGLERRFAFSRNGRFEASISVGYGGLAMTDVRSSLFVEIRCCNPQDAPPPPDDCGCGQKFERLETAFLNVYTLLNSSGGFVPETLFTEDLFEATGIVNSLNGVRERQIESDRLAGLFYVSWGLFGAAFTAFTTAFAALAVQFEAFLASWAAFLVQFEAFLASWATFLVQWEAFVATWATFRAQWAVFLSEWEEFRRKVIEKLDEILARLMRRSRCVVNITRIPENAAKTAGQPVPDVLLAGWVIFFSSTRTQSPVYGQRQYVTFSRQQFVSDVPDATGVVKTENVGYRFNVDFIQ